MRKALDAAVAAIGGEPRAGQIEMAEAVANALSDRHHLLVQAGTGTGKSLAYLVPALVHGKKVLVATATLALQRQLVERDLPRIKPALEKELGRDLTFAVYKGVGNYLCLQKMNGNPDDPDMEVMLEIGALEKDAKKLRDWAQKPGVSGDKDDAPEVDRRVWLANSTSGRECVGKDDCAFGSQCFSAAAKAKAQTADVVVTNHTLLAIEIVDSHPILPERDAIILDEAHEFMDRTTQAVTEELTAGINRWLFSEFWPAFGDHGLRNQSISANLCAAITGGVGQWPDGGLSARSHISKERECQANIGGR